jgi:hypothetical protein
MQDNVIRWQMKQSPGCNIAMLMDGRENNIKTTNLARSNT